MCSPLANRIKELETNTADFDERFVPAALDGALDKIVGDLKKRMSTSSSKCEIGFDLGAQLAKELHTRPSGYLCTIRSRKELGEDKETMAAFATKADEKGMRLDRDSTGNIWIYEKEISRDEEKKKESAPPPEDAVEFLAGIATDHMMHALGMRMERSVAEDRIPVEKQEFDFADLYLTSEIGLEHGKHQDRVWMARFLEANREFLHDDAVKARAYQKFVRRVKKEGFGSEDLPVDRPPAKPFHLLYSESDE